MVPGVLVVIRHQLPHSEIIHARVEDVYPMIGPGSVTLCHVDGPYGMNKAAWDKVKDLAAWYRPHIAEWGRVCAPSASVYLWNTAEGWAAIHPEMVGAGWTFRGLIVWQKSGANPTLVGAANSYKWPDVTEVCGHYQRGDAHHVNPRGCSNVWTYAPTSDMNAERLWSDNMKPRMVSGDENREALHPCQKPLLFARRIVEASSRPGDLVFEPFGGTCRIAAACEAIGRYEPEKARKYLCCEMDEDGRGYIPAVLASLRGELPRGASAQQTRLFGGAA